MNQTVSIAALSSLLLVRKRDMRYAVEVEMLRPALMPRRRGTPRCVRLNDALRLSAHAVLHKLGFGLCLRAKAAKRFANGENEIILKSAGASITLNLIELRELVLKLFHDGFEREPDPVAAEQKGHAL